MTCQRSAISGQRSAGALRCGAAIVLLAGAAARADVVAARGRSAEAGVTITSLIDGQLTWRHPEGREAARGIEEIDYLQVAGWPLFNLAEKQQRDGHYRQAIASYERLLEDVRQRQPSAAPPHASLHEEQRLVLLKCRLLRACDLEGQFGRAVELYVEVLEAPAGGAALAERVRPARLPAPGSTFLQPARAAVDAAISRHAGDALATSLAAWRETWTRAASQPESQSRPADSACARVAPVLASLPGLVEAGKYQQALELLRPVQNPSAGVYQADLYYWQGRALLARAAAPNTREAAADRSRAGLALLRVPIHFPEHPRAAECLARAAEICQADGQPEQAAGLWSELLRSYPDAAPWSDRARAELARLAE